MNSIERKECIGSFGDFIKEHRLKKDMLQQDVAEAVGISQSYYSLIERGEREADLMLAIRLCRALRVDLGNFVKKYM